MIIKYRIELELIELIELIISISFMFQMKIKRIINHSYHLKVVSYNRKCKVYCHERLNAI